MKIDLNETIIKELEEADFHKYSGFYETLRHLTSAETLSIQKSKELLRKVNTFNGKVFICIYKNKIIGIVELVIEQKFIHSGGKCGHIEEVVTHQDYEHNRVATTLLNYAINIAKKLDCYKVLLYNQEELEGFYKQFNFEKKGIFMSLYF